jgi:hypothetical protein
MLRGVGAGAAGPPAGAPANLSRANGPGGGGEFEEYSAVRGAARLATGYTKGALAEAAGGLAAVASAVRQLAGLAEDVRRSAAALSPRRGSIESAESAAAHAGPNVPPRRRRAPAAATSSAA